MTPNRNHALTDLLAQARARIRMLAFMRGACSGAIAAIILGVLALWRGWSASPVALAGAVMAIVAGVITARSTANQRVEIAATIERQQSQNNLLVTATELLDQGDSDRYVTARVLDAASQRATEVHLPTIFPARRALVTTGALIILWLGTIAAVASHPSTSIPLAIEAATATGTNIASLDVLISPPAYLGVDPTHLRNASHIDAIEGSRIEVRIASAANSVSAETLDGALHVSKTGRNLYATSMVAHSDGYIALQSLGPAGQTTDRRMVSIGVTPDAPPRVKITTPGRDLHINDSTSVIDIAIEADDDHALASLTLKYTRVSGSGEQFTFSEGVIASTIDKVDARTWHAHARLALATLKLNRGDMVVYRAIATDGRPGAAPVLSDAFIVEINAPGDERKAGFAADDEQDKYALSQEMVIQKTRELIARAPRMVPDSVHDAAMLLAAEQRSVRAEFVFMMGGEVAEDVIDAADANELHEEAEAQGEADLAAGRAVNKSHIALVDAIRAMSQANTALTAFDLQSGLEAERRALTSLQAAFSHTRYILRGLTQHEQLDMTRRLSGQMAGAEASAAAATSAVESARTTTLRAALAAIDTLRRARAFDETTSGRAAAIGLNVNRAGPSDPLAKKAAQLLTDASSAMLRKNESAARTTLDSAALTVATMLRSTQPETVSAAPASLRGLAGALRDALRVRNP
jgi:hypothetical protein